MEVASPNTDVLLTREEEEEEVMLASFFWWSTLLVDDNRKETGLYVFVILSGVHWDLIEAGSIKTGAKKQMVIFESSLYVL